MDFWHEFSSTITKAADQTVKGAEKLSEMAKVKYKITSLETKLDEAYLTVGKLKYAESMGNDATDEMYNGLFEEISELNEQITELNDKLSQLRNLTVCKGCGTKVNKKGFKFCPECGEKLD